MEDNIRHISALITGRLRETLTDQQQRELDEWLDQSPENRALFHSLADERQMAAELDRFSQYDPARSLEKIRAGFPELAAHRQPARTIRLKWWAAAAAAALLIGTAIYTFQRPQKQPMVQAGPAKPAADAQPGTSVATLTVAGGATIQLDSSAQGALATNDGSRVSKTGHGGLDYDASAEAPVMHTLRTPRGGHYQVTLPDGSKVWLNAASSLSFPTAFTGSSRNVTISGEAYFEVAADAAKPFTVSLPGGGTIAVLGTAFNINAYDNEPSIKTSLVEGRIRITAAGDSKTLLPGEQARITGNRELIIEKHADLEMATAWKEGKISLNGTDLAALMRQLSRWYNVDVEIKNKADRQVIGGVINRNVKLSTVMKALSLYGIETRLENNVLTVY
ncbi:FecR family protein [Chitinophaga sp. NPDC101104]|uniref:FecR family protein n=1 Tax=Chitinophaga sp. NPDC101104 TaxID=3390561 RepID=UPI003CFDFA73